MFSTNLEHKTSDKTEESSDSDFIFLNALKKATNSIDAFIFVKDSNLNLIFSNKAAQEKFQLPNTPLLKSKLQALCPSLTQKSDKEEYALIRNEKDSIESFESIETSQNKVIYVKVTKKLIKSPIENTEFLICTYTDHSGYNKLQQEKKILEKKSLNYSEVSKEKNRFLATVSHEIRTPLNIILGCIDLLTDLKTSELVKQAPLYLEKMSSSANHLNNLIEDVLNISLIENDQLKASPSEFIIGELFLNLSQELSILGKKLNKNLDLKIDPLTKKTNFITDTKFLRQIVSNLVSNSFKYAEVKQCEIYVKAHKNNRLTIKVSDKGVGMSPDDLSRVFEPFYQIDSTETISKSGVGLGLSLVYKLAKEIKGSIKIESALQKGTAVSITLEKLNKKFSKRTSAHKPTDSNKVLAGKKLLIVEDDPDNRFVFGKYFENTGAYVDFAENGLEGWLKFKAMNNALDLMLIDLRMPKLTGYELILKIREWEKSGSKSSVPTICLSANVSKADQEKALDHGFNTFVKKPVSKLDLLESSASLIIKNLEGDSYVKK